MSTDPQTNGNVIPETPTFVPPAPSFVETTRAAFAASGGKVDTKKAVTARDAYIKTNEAVAAAEVALTLAQNRNQEAARALMVATGAQPLKFGGALYNPSCRGETVFYKKAGPPKDVLELK